MVWTTALQLDSARNEIAGSPSALADAIRRAADLRIYTEFLHNEHVDPSSDNPELVKEVAEFGITYLIDDAWSAGIMSLRQPVGLPDHFGSRSSMSFFLYNQNGQQALARPYLDGPPAMGERGPAPAESNPEMPKQHIQEMWDEQTNAPSNNFIWDFETFRYCVSDTWREVLAHDPDGKVKSGSITDLADAFAEGCAMKLALTGLCDDLADDSGAVPHHELFVHGGSGYYYTEQQFYIMGTHPLVRVRPGKPMLYASDNWDFGWVLARTDGGVTYRRCDPYPLQDNDIKLQCGIRWFVR